MNMAVAIDKLAQSPVAEFKEFQRQYGFDQLTLSSRLPKRYGLGSI